MASKVPGIVRVWYYKAGDEQSFNRSLLAAEMQDDRASILLPHYDARRVDDGIYWTDAEVVVVKSKGKLDAGKAAKL